MPTIFENCCGCRLCRGTELVRCPSCGRKLNGLVCRSCGTTEEGGSHLLEVFTPDGKLVHRDHLVWTGGRNPALVVLEDDEVEIWESAKGNLQDARDRVEEADLDDVRAVLPASVHGCDKIHKHQRMLVCGRRR